MQAQGIRHENEKRHKPVVRMKELTLTARDTVDEKLLAALAKLIGQGGEIEIRHCEEQPAEWYRYQGLSK